jgi:tRNA-dihydrouridine synthase 1
MPKSNQFYESINSPSLVVAPMVEGSELAWRILSRNYGAELAYTPMIHSKGFLDTIKSKRGYFAEFNFLGNNEYREEVEEGPLIAQLCGNDPEIVGKASAIMAKSEKMKLSAVDLNLGCPQGIAKRGYYGAFLQEDLPRILLIIEEMKKCGIPVTAKIRILSTIEKTIEYAKALEHAGISLLTIHGRERHQKGTVTGLADWNHIKSVIDKMNIPVFANGNILYYDDIKKCMDATGAVGVMVAETNLYNPSLFNPNKMWAGSILNKPEFFSNPESFSYKLHKTLDFGKYPLLVEHPPALYLTLEYLEICKGLGGGSEWPDGLRPGIVRGHCFKLLRILMNVFVYARTILGSAKNLDDIYNFVLEFSEVVAEGILTGKVEKLGIENIPVTNWDLLVSATVQETNDLGVRVNGGWRKLPFWVAQPYVRSYDEKENEEECGDKRIRSEEGGNQGANALESSQKKIKQQEYCLKCKLSLGAQKCKFFFCKGCCLEEKRSCTSSDDLCSFHWKKFIRNN